MRVIGPCALALLAALPVGAGDLAVTVEGLRSDKGDVRVALFVEAGWLDEKRRVRDAIGKAALPSVRLVIPNVAPGVYGIAGYHDENGNGEHDTNIIGLPLEGFGFSRNAPVRFAPPSFADAMFEVREEGASVAFRIRY